jgi:hypothetical protein
MVEQPLDVDVQIDGRDVPAGRLWTHRHGQSESASFSYRDEYLQRADAYELDPGLPLRTGQHQTALRHALFAALPDCAPDGWGRRLVRRAELQRTRDANTQPRAITEIDFLLGARDDLRQGALRLRALHVVERRPVLVLRRFDRDTAGRIGYASAMTMLQAKDGEQASYLEIAAAIEERCADVEADLRELWRRIVFTILISNTDDHLRNHGFLRRSTAGWSLSPAFDVNPNPEGTARQLATAIDEHSTEASMATALEVAGALDFGTGFRSSTLQLRPLTLGQSSSAQTIVSMSSWRSAVARISASGIRSEMRLPRSVTARATTFLSTGKRSLTKASKKRSTRSWG